MDNPLTPNKILRLLHYAEDKSFSLKKRLAQEEEEKRLDTQEATTNKSSMHLESSSGILDLDKVEGFGEGGISLMSLNKSTAFNPGEMTGRSTGTDEVKVHTERKEPSKKPLEAYDEYGRHSFALESLASNLEKQTMEVNDIMRHSIASNYSFHSKKDMTAEEASFVLNHAPLPVQQSTQVNITADNLPENTTNMSVGGYFQDRCPEFKNIFQMTDSPIRSVRPSISEVSLSTPMNSISNESKKTYVVDQTLDSIPVRQSRAANSEHKIKESTFSMPRNFTVPEISDSSCSTDIPPVKNDLFKVPMSKVYDQEDSSNIKQNLLQKRLLQSLNVEQFLKKASPFQIPNEESGVSVDNDNENSLSISKIADYLGKQSNVSITGMLQLTNQKHAYKKEPLSELHMNVQNTTKAKDRMSVINLKGTEIASSTGKMSIVTSLESLKIKDKIVPTVVVTPSLNKTECSDSDSRKRISRSKSPSSKSPSTLSTVQENHNSFKSNDSPLQKSKEQWAEVRATGVKGYVGTSRDATITITTLSDSWLTTKIHFIDLPDDGEDLTIELPRQPLLLSPGKTEQLKLYITSNVEMNTTLQFKVCLRDASVDADIEQIGKLDVDFKMPTIQAISGDGMNKVIFPTVQENCSTTKFFIIISDCPVDLQLDLSIIENNDVFTIKNVQEIRKSEVNKVLMERDFEEDKMGKTKGKNLNKQLCRLTSGNAIKVSVVFTSPKLNGMDRNETLAKFKSALNINLIGIKNVLNKVDLYGEMGSAKLQVDIPPHKLHISNEPKTIILRNSGNMAGTWFIRIKHKSLNDYNVPFQVSLQRVELRPGAEKDLTITYKGSQDEFVEGTLYFEEAHTGNKTNIDLTGGSDKPKVFPIKTTYRTMSWVRSGRKELNLRNSTNKKIQLRCHIIGDGFTIDLPGVESRGTYCLSFAPNESRSLPVLFAPSSPAPHAAALHLVYDKSCDFSRKVQLFGACSGSCVRWSGLVTYGDTALVRAVARQPLALPLYNKYNVPAFLCAHIRFSLQYRCCEESAVLEGARCVVGARRRHTLQLRVDWARVERRARTQPAAALAALTVLAGPELTRRRILRIIRNKTTGELDKSLLPAHLRVLAQDIEGQEVVSDEALKDFEETTSSLNELIESLQELSAQIDLPQDFADEHTILISDDTVLDHHTLCD
ncbi:PREDICTED: uncharacterized protein LOC106126685 isoform X2 [Papilio xuthus]|uniref:Uncharacterized protein LOC106126685 isoform X2 n=1 Tax=Papilio xuthus TaxID=66420 RepID=A0AAJ6ZVQ2_PAPXU|nr:PREDICTED: uncharacterized protein LOC106126685 isoform X2 [Papilio xuthus]